MDVRVVTHEGLHAREVDELPALLRGPDPVWIDVPSWDDAAADALVKPLGLHEGAVRECAERNALPKVHIYPDHVFVVLRAPETGTQGHVHYIELDQFIGPNWLVTVHGPLGKGVAPAAAETETLAVRRRIDSGRLQADTPQALSHARVTALTGRLRSFLSTLTEEVWRLERTVTAGHMGDAADQLGRIAAMADGQREYLHGAIEFHQTRTNTKTTIAAERLAVIAAVTLPVTVISSLRAFPALRRDVRMVSGGPSAQVSRHVTQRPPSSPRRVPPGVRRRGHRAPRTSTPPQPAVGGGLPALGVRRAGMAPARHAAPARRRASAQRHTQRLVRGLRSGAGARRGPSLARRVTAS